MRTMARGLTEGSGDWNGEEQVYSQGVLRDLPLPKKRQYLAVSLRTPCRD